MFVFGKPGAGWIPIVGDWVHNGTDSIGLYDPTTSTVRLKNSHTGGKADEMFVFGKPGGWKPIAGDWMGSSQSLLAAGGENAASTIVPALTQSELQAIVQEATSRWTDAGLDAAILNKFTQVQFAISNLPSSYLGEAQGDKITIDSDAAGYGWFVDPTPASDEEFAVSQSGQLVAVDPQAVDRIDLLTVVEHELGHIAGLRDLDVLTNDIMSGVLGVGVRRNASCTDAVLNS